MSLIRIAQRCSCLVVLSCRALDCCYRKPEHTHVATPLATKPPCNMRQSYSLSMC